VAENARLAGVVRVLDVTELDGAAFGHGMSFSSSGGQALGRLKYREQGHPLPQHAVLAQGHGGRMTTGEVVEEIEQVVQKTILLPTATVI
jgi:hypothetical protein